MSVSIVVPCYNVAPYVEECLESLVNQSLQDLEIICVNDGSTDATPALLDAWAEKEDRIRVIHRENGGQASARNLGMDMAGGEYVGFVDPDDYVEPSMFARLVEEARRHGADVTACGYTSFSDGDGSVLEELSLVPRCGRGKGSAVKYGPRGFRLGADGRGDVQQTVPEGFSEPARPAF